MNNPLYDIRKAYALSEHEPPPAHIAEMLASIQAVIDRAYTDGYNAGRAEQTSETEAQP